MNLRPASWLDSLIACCCRRGWWRLAEGLSYRTKADNAVARIRWRSPSGNIFYLSPVNFIDRLLLGGDVHDPEVLDCLRELIKPGDVFWDIGANIGFISLEVAASSTDAKVYCFEPSPWISSQLLANATASGRSVNLFSVALSDSEGFLPLMAKFTRNVGQSGFNANPHTKYDGIVHVATVRGDTLIEQGLAEAPDVIKLDVEGHEASVLEGLRGQLSSRKLRAIVYENCDFFGDSQRVAGLLQGAGFNLKQLPGGKDNWVACRG